jgi:peptidoglycan/LPS O-acetylase OafA/YrhL
MEEQSFVKDLPTRTRVGDSGSVRTSTTKSRPQFLDALHGLRGLLAAWVLIYHVSPTLPGAAHGYLAVDVFFVLSGYVLMHTHVRDMAMVSWRRSAAFLVRRFWRTVPLHAACLVLTIALFYFLRSSFPDRAALLESALLLEGWAAPGIGLNVPIWSLGVEWLGYLAFPLMLALAIRIDSVTKLYSMIAAILAIELISLWVSSGQATSNGVQGLNAVIRMAGGFSIGCFLWRAHSAVQTITTGSDTLTMVGVAVTVALLSAVSFPETAIAFLIVVVQAAARPGQWTRKILGHPVALFLGRISFALYLSHFLVLTLALRFQGANPALSYRAIVSTATYLAALGTATALCILVEEPGRRWAAKRTMRARGVPTMV